MKQFYNIMQLNKNAPFTCEYMLFDSSVRTKVRAHKLRVINGVEWNVACYHCRFFRIHILQFAILFKYVLSAHV